MDKISAIIVAKGALPYILKSVSSVKNLASEIVIVDIGADKRVLDQLKKIEHLRIVKIGEHIPYVELIRERVKNFARCPYILFLDPDEVLPEHLRKLIASKLEDYDYFMIPRKNIIFGKWIRHSRWWPDYQIRLFRKEAVVWPTIIHQQPLASGKFYKVEPQEELALIHYNYEAIDEYIEKAARYAKAEAFSYKNKRQSLTLTSTVQKALSEFVSRYFAGKGYEDGVHGLILAVLQMWYCFLVYFYFCEIEAYRIAETPKTLKTQIEGFFQQGLKEILHWKSKRTLKERIVKKLIS